MKRLIGIDIGAKTLRVAVLEKEGGGLRVIALEESRHENQAEQLARLKTLLGDLNFGDRITTCLPAGSAFIRQLQFPFHERKKISAALPYELSGQLPVSLDDYSTFMQPPRRIEDGAEVVAAAVRTDLLEDFLQLFDGSGLPLQVLDVAPYAYVAGLGDSLADGILVVATEQETCLALVNHGRVLSFRQLPGGAGGHPANHAVAVCREAVSMQRTSETEDVPLFIAGGEASAELVAEISRHMDNVELLSTRIGDEAIDSAFIPAVALALRGSAAEKSPSFNLRQGAFRLRGEWGGLRRAMIVAATLAGLTLLILGVSMGFQYSNKRQQLDNLQQQMVDIYRKTVPGTGAIVDVPLQMQSAVRQLQEDAGMIAMDRPSAVELLRQLSDLPDGLNVDFDEFTFDQGQVRISGKTETFEFVNRLAETYRSAPEFTSVEVTESKMGIAGQQVAFRMTLMLQQGGAQ